MDISFLSERFAERQGFEIDIRSYEYANIWLRTPNPRLPLPDVRHWYREPGLWLPLSLAIAYDSDAAGAATNGTTSQTVSLTVPGGSTALLSAVVADSSDVITGVTWNGSALTLIQKSNVVGGDRWIYQHHIGSPASGTHNLIASASGSVYIGVCGSSYTGSVTTIPTVFAISTTDTSPQTISVTVGVANSWLIGAGRSQAADVTAGTGTTRRAGDGFGGGAGIAGIFDSNGALATGSRSLQVTGASTVGLGVAALEPSGGGSSRPLFRDGVSLNGLSIGGSFLGDPLACVKVRHA